ncbi:MAG: acyl-CoA dehydrogenase family protein, partial [Pseudomonadales bacterium]
QPVFNIPEITTPQLTLTGLDCPLSEEDTAIQETVHRFAADVVRPTGIALDKLSAEEVIAPNSPLWEFIEAFNGLGVGPDMLASLEPEQAARLFPIILEELCWGDVGLGLSTMVMKFPAIAAQMTGQPEVAERFAGLRGCWLGTQPDRGSDVLDLHGTNLHPGTRQARGNLTARIDGDEVVIRGQSSAWVSTAPIAECSLAYLPCDYGDGIIADNGTANGIGILIPFDLPGISKGNPLEKIGQRPLCQGEIFFDEVRVPGDFIIAGKDEYAASFFGALTFANMEMGIGFTGLARAAYEHALAYVHERKQGGTAIINHQSVKHRLFGMWQKVELCRAISRRAVHYNFVSGHPHVLASITSKTSVTQMALEVASEAVQLFGGNGLTLEYPVEKLFRDARASLIEDGENNVLDMIGASWLSKHYCEQNQITV